MKQKLQRYVPMSNIDSFGGMDDDAFEAALANGGPESIEETPSASLSGSEDDNSQELDETHEDGVESSTEASEEATDGTDEPEENANEEEESLDDDQESDEPKETSTEAQLAELFKPFKAGKREQSVTSVEEARRLMEMGSQFAQKMAGFKPHRKRIKVLEDNKIDDATLNHLIDLSKGDKGAIAKLLQDHSIDTMDLDSQEDSDYTPSNYSVSDAQVEMDDVISRIQDTPSFSSTSDIVTNRWDEASKNVIFENPNLLEMLNTQVSDGTYERVMTEVERLKMFGGLQGLSDIQAYDMVGKQIATQQVQQPTATVKTKPEPKATNTDRKRRASPSKKAPKKTAQPEYNYGGMSDSDFEKLLKGN